MCTGHGLARLGADELSNADFVLRIADGEPSGHGDGVDAVLVLRECGEYGGFVEGPYSDAGRVVPAIDARLS